MMASTRARDRSDRPRAKPPQRAPVQIVILSDQAEQARVASVFRLSARSSRFLAIRRLPAPTQRANQVALEYQETRFRVLRTIPAWPVMFSGLAKTLYEGGGNVASGTANRMTSRTSLTIVLAAGEGTRMRSSLPKVLHQVAGETLLAHVLKAAPAGDGAALAVVIGPDHQAVAEEARRVRPQARTYVQRERLGTAHAVLAAREAIAAGVDDLLVAFGDTPLISADTFERLRAAAGARGGAGGARVSARGPDRLRPAAGRERSAGRYPRTRRRQRR